MSGTTPQRHSQRQSQCSSEKRRGGSDTHKARQGPCRRLRVILLGDMRVGKTSLLQRFVQGKFDPRVARTCAIEEMEKEVTVDNQRYILRVVDTCGGERFRSLRENFYRGTHVCLLTFALDNFSSFCNLTMWRDEFLYYADVPIGTDFPFLILGNKADIQERAVSDPNIQAWCRANGEVPYFETSAKQALNVEEVFVAAVLRFHELAAQNGPCSSVASRKAVIDDLRDQGQQNPQRSGCCS